MARQKWSWTKLQNRRAEDVKAVIDGLVEYWPLTLRQIYYRLVAALVIENKKSNYQALSKLLKWMRIDEMVPWGCLEDRTRSVSDKRGFESMEQFIEQETEWLFDGYTRCLVQGQDKYVELWSEKDALRRIFEEVAHPYCLRAVTCKGYQSVTFISDFYKRAAKAIMQGKTPTVLYFGDLDPSGVQMLEASIETLENELGLYGVVFKRVGLLPEHIAEYNLPNDPTAIKKTDSRYKKYKAIYGDVAVELDALHPKILKALAVSAVENELDISEFARQREQEAVDHGILSEFRSRALKAVDQIKADLSLEY